MREREGDRERDEGVRDILNRRRYTTDVLIIEMNMVENQGGGREGGMEGKGGGRERGGREREGEWGGEREGREREWEGERETKIEGKLTRLTSRLPKRIWWRCLGFVLLSMTCALTE